ncbi:MAG: histidinol-phosphate transaminase [Anaerolineae bacterium]
MKNKSEKPIEHLKLNPCIRSAQLYVAGTTIEEIRHKYGLEEIIKLASNENALGPSPLAVEAMQKALAGIHRYPPVADDELRAKLASTLSDGNLSEECFITGNGSCDVLEMIARAFLCEEGDEAIMCPPTFVLYEIVVNICGGKCVFVDLKDDFTYDLSQVLASITDRTRLIFLCNPNNPTGTVIDRDGLNDFLAQVPSRVLVVIDEAYWEYVDPELLPDTLAYIREGRNVMSVRTFAKVYGLAGLRIGYGIAYEELAQYIRRLRLPFHINAVSMRGAIAALDDREHIEKSVQHNRVEREFLYAGLDDLELPYARSQGNFIIVRPGYDPQLIYERMLETGVIIRPLAAFRAPDCFRISVGTRAENERLLQVLGEVMDGLRRDS